MPAMPVVPAVVRVGSAARGLAALSVLAVLAMAPAGPAPRPAFVPPAAEALVAGEVDQARMQATVHELVRLGPRMGGTPSGARAAAAIAAAFAGAGLAPETVEDPPHPVHWEDSWTVELVPGGCLASAYPYGFSPPIGPVTAPLAVAADPARLASAPPRADWRGKILYLPGDVVRRAYPRLAAAAGRPLALLTDAPGDGRRYLDAAYVAALPAMPGGGPRPLPVFALSYQDGRKVAAAAATAAPAPGAAVRLALRSTVGQGRPRTVLATLPGRDPDHYYLVCAHGDSDSGGPGADDNGSGEAVVLELARVLAGLVRGGRLPAPSVGLRFAVWGSEYASSSAYVARQGERLRRCLGVVNLDEVGTGAERDAIYFESNEVPWNRALLRAFDRVGADYAGRPGFWPEYTTNPFTGRHRLLRLPAPALPGRARERSQGPRHDRLHRRLGPPRPPAPDPRLGVPGHPRSRPSGDRLLALLPLVGRHPGEHHRPQARGDGARRPRHRHRAAPPRVPAGGLDQPSYVGGTVPTIVPRSEVMSG
jgi:hypothetical protein